MDWKANMIRISGADYSGAKESLTKDVTDYIMESDSKNELKTGNWRAFGKLVIYSEAAETKQFYFVRKSRFYRNK